MKKSRSKENFLQMFWKDSKLMNAKESPETPNMNLQKLMVWKLRIRPLLAARASTQKVEAL